MKKLLLVVDPQNDFITGTLGTSGSEKIVPNIVRKIVNFDGDILYTLDTHYGNYNETREGKYLPVSHCVHKTWGWQVESSVNMALDSKGAVGYTKESFVMSKRMLEIIENNKYEEITIIGYVTNVCVISNALLLRGFMQDAQIIVDESCCIGVSLARHYEALRIMGTCHIDIIGR